jgi:hypothetical protein
VPKVAVINPTWQIYRGAELKKRLGGKPIGLGLWNRQLKHRVAAGSARRRGGAGRRSTTRRCRTSATSTRSSVEQPGPRWASQKGLNHDGCAWFFGLSGCGSRFFSAGVAAIEEGYRFIGVEIKASYCALGCKRIELALKEHKSRGEGSGGS